MAGLGWLVFSSIAGLLSQAGFYSVVLEEGWLRLAFITRWVANAGLCMVVLMEEWSTLACVQQYCWMADLGWLVFRSIAEWVAYTSFNLVFSSITGEPAQAGLCSVVLQDGCPKLACVQ